MFGEPIIQTKELWHVYLPDIVALRGIDLNIYKGEFIGLIGQNGSGKTTLVKHFDGLLKPTKGSVLVKGKDTRKTTISKLATIVGYVFQNPDHMLFANTIEDEVSFAPRMFELPEEEIKERVDLALKTLGLEQYRKESAFFLGKGMRRKVTLAAMLSMKPEVMIIDEPTTGMDFRGCTEIMNLISKLHQEGHTIIAITHDMRMVADYTHRTIAMYNGEVLLDYPTKEIFSYPEELSKIFLRPPQITRLAQKLAEFGVPPDVLEVEELHRILRDIRSKQK